MIDFYILWHDVRISKNHVVFPIYNKKELFFIIYFHSKMSMVILIVAFIVVLFCTLDGYI